MVVVTNTQSLVKVGSKICHIHAVLNSKCAKFKLEGAAAAGEWEEEAVKWRVLHQVETLWMIWWRLLNAIKHSCAVNLNLNFPVNGKISRRLMSYLPITAKPMFDGEHAVSRHFITRFARFISLFRRTHTHTRSFAFYSLSDIFVLIHLKEEK